MYKGYILNPFDLEKWKLKTKYMMVNVNLIKIFPTWLLYSIWWGNYQYKDIGIK